MPAYKPVAERFSAKYEVNPETGCWDWKGTRVTGGYGMIGRGEGERGAVLAHRLSYELHVGKIPVGCIVMHACDNPGCVNHRHLRLGTHADNMKDMERKGRARVLSAEQVQQAGVWVRDGASLMAAARNLGVNRSTLDRAFKRAAAGDSGPTDALSGGDRPHRKLTDEQRAEAVRLLREGERVMTVAKRFGVDRRTIRNLRPSDIPSPPRGRPATMH